LLLVEGIHYTDEEERSQYTQEEESQCTEEEESQSLLGKQWQTRQNSCINMTKLSYLKKLKFNGSLPLIVLFRVTAWKCFLSQDQQHRVTFLKC
jgi:hypothetical protein